MSTPIIDFFFFLLLWILVFIVENMIGGRTMHRWDYKRHNIDRNSLSSRFLRDFHLSKEFCLIYLKALSMKLSQQMIRLNLNDPDAGISISRIEESHVPIALV